MRAFARKISIRWGIAMLVAAIIASAAGIVYWQRSGNDTGQAAAKLTHAEFMTEQQALVAAMQAKGSDGSFALLRERMADDPSVARECHPLLHMVGHAAYEQYYGFAAALEQQDELCNSGYIHGVIEAAFQHSNDWVTTMQTICPADTVPTYKQWQCFHGVGHGLMYALHKDAAKSLPFCEQLPTPLATQSCVNGVFMEQFIVVSHTGGRSSKGNTDHTFCLDLRAQYKPDCYIYAPTAFLEGNPNNYRKAFDWCTGIERAYIEICAQGVGSQAMKENVTRPAFAAKLCGSISENLRLACIQGAVAVYIHHFAATGPARTLCEGKDFAPFKNTCRAIIEVKRQELAI